MIPLSLLDSQFRDHLFDQLLPFWMGPARDRASGGWVPWMTNDGQVDRTQPQGLILNTRLLWSFSAAYRARPEPVYAELAERALNIVLKRFWDAEHGGAFWRIDSEGRALDTSKKTYGQAFYIYSLAEHHMAFGSPPTLERAVELFELTERHAHDPEQGGFLEVCGRDWSVATDQRLSDKDANEKRSMNNHVHLLEAYTNLRRVWKNPRLDERLRELLGVFADRIFDPATGHLHHFFDERWRGRSESYTFGHDIEASWLLCEAAEVLEDAALAKQARRVALRLARSALEEGLDPEGGLFYEGRGGMIVDRGKEWWPQAEAIIGFLNAFQASGDQRFLDAVEGIWNFIQQHLVDRAHGEWFWRIQPDGRPDPTLPKVSEWKDPYHGVRACLEASRRLRAIDNKLNDRPAAQVQNATTA